MLSDSGILRSSWCQCQTLRGYTKRDSRNRDVGISESKKLVAACISMRSVVKRPSQLLAEVQALHGRGCGSTTSGPGQRLLSLGGGGGGGGGGGSGSGCGGGCCCCCSCEFWGIGEIR